MMLTFCRKEFKSYYINTYNYTKHTIEKVVNSRFEYKSFAVV